MASYLAWLKLGSGFPLLLLSRVGGKVQRLTNAGVLAIFSE